MSHESMSLDEEKRLMKEIKQLEGTRARVMANEASRAKLDNDTEKDALQDKVKVCLFCSDASLCIIPPTFCMFPMLCVLNRTLEVSMCCIIPYLREKNYI